MEWIDQEIERIAMKQIEKHNICCCGECERARACLEIVRGEKLA